MRWKSNQIQYFRNLTGCAPGAKRGGEERAGGEKSPSPQKSTFPNINSIWNAQTHLNVFLRTLKFLVGKQISIVFFRRLPRRLSLNNIQLSPEGEVNGGRFLPNTWSVEVNIERCSPTLRGIVALVFTKSVGYIWWRKQLFVI